jgi:hypothetical protein
MLLSQHMSLLVALSMGHFTGTTAAADAYAAACACTVTLQGPCAGRMWLSMCADWRSVLKPSGLTCLLLLPARVLPLCRCAVPVVQRRPTVRAVDSAGR